MNRFLLFLILFLFVLYFKNMKKMFNEKDAVDAFNWLKLNKGIERAQLFERFMRQETNHFKSLQYRITGTGGMMSGNWKNLPDTFKTIKDERLDDKGLKGLESWIVVPSVTEFAKYWSDYVDRRGLSNWNPIDKDYLNKINKIKNRFV